MNTSKVYGECHQEELLYLICLPRVAGITVIPRQLRTLWPKYLMTYQSLIALLLAFLLALLLALPLMLPLVVLLEVNLP